MNTNPVNIPGTEVFQHFYWLKSVSDLTKAIATLETSKGLANQKNIGAANSDCAQLAQWEG